MRRGWLLLVLEVAESNNQLSVSLKCGIILRHCLQFALVSEDRCLIGYACREGKKARELTRVFVMEGCCKDMQSISFQYSLVYSSVMLRWFARDGGVHTTESFVML